MGHLAAWLEVADAHATRDSHMSCSGASFSRASRGGARASLLAAAGAEALSEKEREKREGEEDEPARAA